ncbi:MAG: hypothetical protein U0136_04270 [Bdellovibrionota bacterium]
MKLFGMVSTRSSVEYTYHALSSFFRNTPLDSSDSFTLIDNDGSVTDDLLSGFPQCKRVTNNRPLSFAQNANSLIREALPRGADLYFLNNDVIFTEGWLQPLAVERPAILSPLCNREVQYASSVMVTKTSHIANLFVTGVGMSLSEYLGNEAAFAAIVEAHRKTVTGFLQVYVLPFFCVKIPAVILDAVGQFDETFGIGGGEDFDYALRTYLAGFNVEYALQSFCLHFGGKSTWSGAETEDEQLERVSKYQTVFFEKWGEELQKLILREDRRVVDDVESVRAHDVSGDLRAVVLSLLGDRQIRVKI